MGFFTLHIKATLELLLTPRALETTLTHLLLPYFLIPTLPIPAYIKIFRCRAEQFAVTKTSVPVLMFNVFRKVRQLSIKFNKKN